MEETFTELLQSATEMLLDRPEPERELIIAVAKLGDEERAALILAYQNIKRAGCM